MKNMVFILILGFMALSANAQPKAKIGMTLDEVKSLYPNSTVEKSDGNTVLTYNENIYGLENKWGIRFKENKVDWMFFHHYVNDFNEAAFAECLSAAKNLIADYEKVYGKPDAFELGDTTYKDPYVKRHWGYNVIEARWNNVENMKVKIEFKFFGGKGDYFLLFEVHFFDKDYPYFN